MANALPPLWIDCPRSDHEWRGSPRSWSDASGLYSLACPSCGARIRFAVVDGNLAELPGWAGPANPDHGLTLTGASR